MDLVQPFLPLYESNHYRFEQNAFDPVRDELTERFGGPTAYARPPAAGLWKKEQGGRACDEIVIYEALVEQLDRDCWQAYRRQLAAPSKQEQMLVRATEIELL